MFLFFDIHSSIPLIDILKLLDEKEVLVGEFFQLLLEVDSAILILARRIMQNYMILPLVTNPSSSPEELSILKEAFRQLCYNQHVPSMIFYL